MKAKMEPIDERQRWHLVNKERLEKSKEPFDWEPNALAHWVGGTDESYKTDNQIPWSNSVWQAINRNAVSCSLVMHSVRGYSHGYAQFMVMHRYQNRDYLQRVPIKPQRAISPRVEWI